MSSLLFSYAIFKVLFINVSFSLRYGQYNTQILFVCQQNSISPLVLLRKEVIQPHLPIRLPCYDFTPVINPTFGSALLAVRLLTSGVTDSHGVTGGVYKARERIHRGMLIRDYQQLRLHVGGLQPTIRTGTAFMRSASAYAVASLCYSHCSTCVAQDVRGMMI